MANDSFIRKRLFELIDNSDITPTRLSEELHLNKGYFADVRREKQSVPYDVLSQVCDYFHITLSEFFDPDYSLRNTHREISLLCQQVSEDRLKNIIIPILKLFAEKAD